MERYPIYMRVIYTKKMNNNKIKEKLNKSNLQNKQIHREIKD